LSVLRASPHRAIFDLAHLESLSSAQGLNLFVSPRTLYVLQNLVAADVGDWTRYAKQILEGGWYITPSEEDDEWQTMLDTIEGVEVEVYPLMAETYTRVINAIEEEVVVTGDTLNMYVFVPEGETWELLALACNKEGPAGDIRAHLRDEVGTLCAELFYETQGSGKAAWVKWQGRVLLGPEESFRVRFYGCTATEKCSVAYCAGVLA
jgi:hypothetical protein